MLWIREHSQKRQVRDVAPQTILTNFPDLVGVPKGSFVIYMGTEKAIWKSSLLNRAQELGGHFPSYWPYTYPLYYIMRAESHLKGAEIW